MLALCCVLPIASINPLPVANPSELVLFKKEVEDRFEILHQSFGIPTQDLNIIPALWIMMLLFSNWTVHCPLMMTLNLHVCHLLPPTLVLLLLKNDASPVDGELCHQVDLHQIHASLFEYQPSLTLLATMIMVVQSLIL